MTSKSKAEDTRYKVNLWVTNLNDLEIGILPSTQHRAKSRQFTKDMDIIGDVKEDGERIAIIAYRKGLWKDHKGMEKRLVIKLFTANMNWRGTMDLMIGRSLQLSHGAGNFPVTAFAMNLANHDQLIQIERSAFKWPMFPEKFSFFILKDGKPHFYRLRKVIFAFGADYKLYDQGNKVVGYLDGKVINLGGAWKVRVDAEHVSKELNSVLQMFCAMLKFNQASQAHIDGLLHEMNEGRMLPAIEAQESALYMNPRAMR